MHRTSGENVKTLLKDIKDDLRDIPYLQRRCLNIEQISIIFKLNCEFNVVSIKIPARYF